MTRGSQERSPPSDLVWFSTGLVLEYSVLPGAPHLFCLLWKRTGAGVSLLS